MKSIVYYGSPRQALLEANETLPAKLDLIINKLNIRDRVKDEAVVIKNAHRQQHLLFHHSPGIRAQTGPGGEGRGWKAIYRRCELGC